MTEFISIARPYAKAVFQISSETDSIDQWSVVLSAMAEACNEREIESVLTDVSIDKNTKAECFTSVLKDKCSEEQIRFVMLLSENGRLILLPAISKIFHDQVNEHRQSEEVSVYSAYNLDDEQMQEIKDKITQKLNKVVSLYQYLDSDLIGGIRIKGKGWIIDASIEGQLKALARNLNI